jgi:hypothetical protein
MNEKEIFKSNRALKFHEKLFRFSRIVGKNREKEENRFRMRKAMQKAKALFSHKTV